MKREIEAPEQEYLDETQAYDWLAKQFKISARLFEDMLASGFIPGVLRVRQAVQVHWKGVVCALWRLQAGELPPENLGATEGRGGAKPGRTGAKEAHGRESDGV